jgi:hypothetical protein
VVHHIGRKRLRISSARWPAAKSLNEDFDRVTGDSDAHRECSRRNAARRRQQIVGSTLVITT